MRTAIRNLGWLFLFLGGLKSLMWLMCGFMGHTTTSSTTTTRPITTSLLPQASSNKQKTDCHHW